MTVQIRVGLNCGEVMVRAIGNDLHMDYTAVGETTHLAARIEQAARRGLTRFVGRDAEIEVLRRSLEHAGAGHGQAVAIVGEAGAKALARSAYREAVTCFKQALAALHPLPDTPQKTERAIDFRLNLR